MRSPHGFGGKKSRYGYPAHLENWLPPNTINLVAVTGAASAAIDTVMCYTVYNHCWWALVDTAVAPLHAIIRRAVTDAPRRRPEQKAAQ